MLVNLKLRAQNKAFWLTIIPSTLLLIQLVLQLFGINIAVDVLGEQLGAIVNAAFGVLSALGVVADTTTPGFSDSERALNRETLGVD